MVGFIRHRSVNAAPDQATLTGIILRTGDDDEPLRACAGAADISDDRIALSGTTFSTGGQKALRKRSARARSPARR
jgi:hypothetical protein